MSGPAPQNRDAKPRTRDPLYDAIVLACGLDYDGMTTPLRKQVGVAASEIRKVGGSPADVAQRAQLYKTRHRTWDLTPMRLMKWLASLAPPRRVDSNGRDVWSREPVVLED